MRAEESGASCYFAKILAYTGEFHPCTFPAPASAPAPRLREPFTLFTPGRISGRREAPTTRLGLSLREILNHPCQQIDHAVELLLTGGDVSSFDPLPRDQDVEATRAFKSRTACDLEELLTVPLRPFPIAFRNVIGNA